MSSTRIEPESSSSERRLYTQVGYSVFTCIIISRLVGRRHSSTFKTAYTDACKTYHTITAHTTVFLKMNPRVRNA
jgi:hypothetical protein